jgi:ABC-2 type transport system ATP-binding protein
VLIDDGRVVANGRLSDLRREDARRLVRVEVDGDANANANANANGWLAALPGVTVLEPLPGGGIIELTDGAREDDILDAARAAGSVRTFSVVEPSLADLFRRAVGA